MVRGDVRTYRIHLGSGNVLMEPNAQYLCIVPVRGAAHVSGKMFLPFEGDRTLAIILSKAFLLAEDKEIGIIPLTPHKTHRTARMAGCCGFSGERLSDLSRWSVLS